MTLPRNQASCDKCDIRPYLKPAIQSGLMTRTNSEVLSRLNTCSNAGRHQAPLDGRRHRAAAGGTGGRQITARGSQRRRPRSAGPGWTSAAAPGSGRPVASTAGGPPLTRPTCSRCSGDPAMAVLAAAVMGGPTWTHSYRCKRLRRVLDSTILSRFVDKG